jgi:hypothetical protein
MDRADTRGAIEAHRKQVHHAVAPDIEVGTAHGEGQDGDRRRRGDGIGSCGGGVVTRTGQRQCNGDNGQDRNATQGELPRMLSCPAAGVRLVAGTGFPCQFRDEFATAREAVCRGLLEQPLDDPDRPRRDVPQCREIGLIMDNRLDHGAIIAAAERARARQHFVQYDPETPEVGGRSDMFAVGLLR